VPQRDSLINRLERLEDFRGGPCRPGSRLPASVVVPALLALFLGAAAYLLWRFDPREVRLWVCLFHATTGFYCPGCGATRATHELLHGRLLSALHDNAFWVAALPLVACTAVSEALHLVRGRGLMRYALLARPRLMIALAVAGLLFGVLRNIHAYPWTLLVPR